MKNVNFEVSEELFGTKPTEADYILSALENEKGNIDLVYINVDNNGKITTEKIEVTGTKFNRNIIEQEKLDTYMRIIDLNDWQYACAIYELDGKIYDALCSRNTKLILSILGLSTSFIVGKGLSIIHTDPNSAFFYILIGGSLMFLALKNHYKYLLNNYEYKYLKEQKENLILDRVSKLVRKK